MRTYGRLLRHPSTALSLVAALIGAIPIGMWPLAIVLGVLDGGGTAADAGVLAAVFGVGNAVGVVTQGALLARVRASLLLPLFSVLGLVAAVLLLGDLRPGGCGACRHRDPRRHARGAGTVRELAAGRRPARRVRARERAVPGGHRDRSARRRRARDLGAGAARRRSRRARRRRPPCCSPRAPRAAGTPRGCGRAGVGAPVVGGRLVLLGIAAAAGFGIGTLQVLVPLRSGAAASGAAFALLALAEVAGAVLVGGRVGPRHAFRHARRRHRGRWRSVYLLLGAGVGAVSRRSCSAWRPRCSRSARRSRSTASSRPAACRRSSRCRSRCSSSGRPRGARRGRRSRPPRSSLAGGAAARRRRSSRRPTAPAQPCGPRGVDAGGRPAHAR